jgi:hypothetical protein
MHPPAGGSTGALWGSTTPPAGGDSTARDPKTPGPIGHRLGSLHVSDPRGAWEGALSDRTTYIPVIVALSFWGGTKKSHSELPVALMGRPNKEGSATDKGANLYYVEPLQMALPHCFNDRWDRSCHVGRSVAPLTRLHTIEGSTTVTGSTKRIRFWDSFRIGSFRAEVLVKGQFCRFHLGSEGACQPSPSWRPPWGQLCHGST